MTWDAEVLIYRVKEVDSAILACKDGSVLNSTSKGPWGGPSPVTMRRFDFGTGNRPIEKECVALPLARGGNRLPRVATGEVHETLEVAPPRPRKPSKMRRWSMVEWCSGQDQDSKERSRRSERCARQMLRVQAFASPKVSGT